MGRFMKVKILDRWNVSPWQQSSPPPSSSSPPQLPTAITSLPLTFFDIPWLFFSPSQPLFFYDYPHSTHHFISSVFPLLKASLSLALRSFFPFAGSLQIDDGRLQSPSLACSDHLQISLLVAESGDDFDVLVSRKFPRESVRFQTLVPSLLSPGDKESVPLMSVQITVFSGCGFCVGIAYHHVAADERTFNNFMKSWTSSCRFAGNLPLLPLPSMDRSVIRDGYVLQQRFEKEWWKRRFSFPSVKPLDGGVRSTFVLASADLSLIKSQILEHCTSKNLPLPVHLSPYVLACSFVWVNWVKTHDRKVEDRLDPIYFGFIAGGITRLDYPVPDTYFGNCVGFGRGEAIYEEIVGADGMAVAASAIAKAIKKLDKSLLDGAEGWIREWEVFSDSDLHLMVSGSPKVEFYETDFGWGKPKKIEQVSIDRTKAVSLYQSRDAEGGMEVGLSLPRNKMEKFNSLFTRALQGQD